MISSEITHRLSHIRLFALDVDGVLTDGGVYVMDDGMELRRFDIKDGLGLKRLLDAGIQVVIISASNSSSIQHRMQRLGLDHVYLDVKDKRKFLLRLCREFGIPLASVAYMGDDLTDLPAMHEVGLPCAPADAVEAVKQVAMIVTSLPGGHGAVREICEMIVKSHTCDIP